MKRIKISILMLALSGVFLHACQQPTEDKANTKKESKVFPIKQIDLEKEKMIRSLEYTANMVAFEEIHLAPASPGRIESINVEVGDHVKMGKVLIEMDNTQLRQAIIQMENARSNYRRLDTLYNLGSISEQQYEQVQTQYEVAKSNVEFLEENTTIVSPLTGIVTAKYFEAKEMYSGAPNTAAGKAAVITLMQIHPLKAFISVSERYFPVLEEGMKAQLRMDMYPGEVFTGEIFRIHPTIDPTNRTFNIELSIPNAAERLRPGMFASFKLEVGEEEMLVVPAIAVTREEGTNNRYVYLNRNGKAKRFQVKIGKRFDDKLEIRSSAIQAGDKLIVAGQASIEDGAEVKVVK